MVYLDNAATTFPKPLIVSEAVYRFIKNKSANPGRSGHKLSMAAAEEVYKCRDAVSKLINAGGSECVAFTLNATQAINLALKGRLKAGDHVITSSLEHNAIMRPLYKMSTEGVEYSTAEVDLFDDDVTVANFKSLIRSNTKMIACTHSSNLCGRLLPAARLGALCKEHGLEFLLDASQTAGLVEIDVQAMNIDYFCAPGHKSLYGPMGTGLIVTSKGEELDTLIEGGTGSNSVNFEQPDFMPDRLESGTINAPGIAGLRAGIEYVKVKGISKLYSDETKLALLLYKLLQSIDGIKLYTPEPLDGYMPVICFNIGDISSVDAVSYFDSVGIALRGGLHCTPAAHTFFGTLSQGMIRASFGAANTTEDVVSLINAAKSMPKVM